MDEIYSIMYALLNSSFMHTFLRLLLAVCFGALIGMEREHAHRPAGLRTHILVCLGSCLVMITSEYIYSIYHQFSPNMDVNRLGAQVISGIGFLGAGTIIRNGSSVKGLTTAASIWAVACIGIATGVGFYAGATISTIIIFIVLSYIKSHSKFYNTKKLFLSVVTTSADVAVAIEKKLFSNSIEVNNVSLKPASGTECFYITFGLTVNSSINPTSAVSDIYSLPGVTSVNINEKDIIKDEE